MKFDTASCLITFFGLVSAAPISQYSDLRTREVPQEKSHNKILTAVQTTLQTNNPDKIVDSVFGLLGDAAGAAGEGDITNTDCLQQATADQAFTNAKATGDVDGMVNAILYRALERNTGKVGLASVPCNETAKNPEIQAITQHQDAASPNAAAINKAIVLEVAKQIASIGGDPLLALESGTFAPGDPNDPTGAGNSCDDPTDAEGCIFTQNLLVDDATPDEISSAVAGITAATPVAAAAGSSTETAIESAAATTAAAIATSSASSCAASSPAVVAAAATTAATALAASGQNLQTFTGDLGGLPPPVFNQGGARPFIVDGSTFLNLNAALQRSCSEQHNNCADQANSGKLSGGESQCEDQENLCSAAISAKAKRAELDFGSCSNPAILFENGLDGRNEPAFIAANQNDFPHGSALNIKVIADFICGQLESKCKASSTTVSTCTSAATAAEALTSQAAANAFNSALGVSGDSSTASASDNASSSTAAVVAATSAAATAGNCAEAVDASTKTAAAPASSATSTAAASGQNLQTFTGSLGGLPPPVINQGGARPFVVNGDTFLNLSAALDRSCSVQHNDCADAANSGALSGGEEQCEEQETACNENSGV